MRLKNKYSLLLLVTGLLLGSCCNEDFITPTLDYDFLEYAMDVTTMIGSCSANEAYTTVGATPDQNAGDCWGASPAPRHNRWFKFTATAVGEIYISINVGLSSGTQRRTYAALWDTDGTTQLNCAFYDNEDSGVFLSGSLTPGEIYYFSVDVADDDGQGTFSLCIVDAF